MSAVAVGILIVVVAAVAASTAWVIRGYVAGVEDAEELRRTNASLRHANEDLEQFAHAAAHDLKEPLRTIALYTEALFEDYGGVLLEEEAREYRTFIVQAAEHAQALVADLLRFSRAGKGLVSVVLPLDLPIRDALEELRGAIASSGAVVIVPDDLPRVQADRAMIARLMTNLLSNAIKFHVPGKVPRVWIEARRLSAAEVEISVSDRGIGIETEYLDAIFDVFRRLHPQDKYQGTGIGLALARRIVTAHGGKIWATSDGYGTGSTIHFTLRTP